MVDAKIQKLYLYVDKVSRRWVVQDADGVYWTIPDTENPWEHKQRLERTDETELEPIPNHYKYMLGLFN